MAHRSIRLPESATDLELVAAAQVGDPAAFDRLADRYQRFVRSRSRGYFLVGGDREDVEQEAFIGFYKSVRDFKPELQASFRAFAELCINRQIITAIKAANRKKHAPLNQSVPFYAPRPGDDPGDASEDLPAVADALADPAEQLVALEGLAVTHGALADRLSPLEVQVVSRFVEGRSYEAIAGELGRHVKAVDNALQRVKRKLAQHQAERDEHDALT